MNHSGKFPLAVFTTCIALPYLHLDSTRKFQPSIHESEVSPEQRVANLVQRMTLEEKAWQLVNLGASDSASQPTGVRLVERGPAWRLC